MRYYFIDREQEEVVIHIEKVEIKTPYLFEFTLSHHHHEGKLLHPPYLPEYRMAAHKRHKVYVRKLGEKYFVSHDSISWKKVPKLNISPSITVKHKVLEVFRGHRPSGLMVGKKEGGPITEMNCKVVKLFVKPGSVVKKGQCLVVLEAMKMENEVRSSIDGVIKNVYVKDGDVLDKGILLVDFE